MDNISMLEADHTDIFCRSVMLCVWVMSLQHSKLCGDDQTDNPPGALYMWQEYNSQNPRLTAHIGKDSEGAPRFPMLLYCIYKVFIIARELYIS